MTPQHLADAHFSSAERQPSAVAADGAVRTAPDLGAPDRRGRTPVLDRDFMAAGPKSGPRAPGQLRPLAESECRADVVSPLASMHAEAPVTAAGKSIAVDVDTLTDLSRIFDSAFHLVQLPRSLPTRLIDYLHAAHASGALGSGRRAVIDAGSPLPAGTLPELPGRDIVDADVQCLSELLADLTGCTRVGVRIEVLDRAMCPRWHVDRVALRLLCTWIGPATEWLDERCADRSRLGSDAVMTDAAGIGRAAAGDIVLLKGELWPGNAGRGVIHRSPQLDAPHRLRIVAAFDAVF